MWLLFILAAVTKMFSALWSVASKSEEKEMLAAGHRPMCMAIRKFKLFSFNTSEHRKFLAARNSSSLGGIFMVSQSFSPLYSS